MRINGKKEKFSTIAISEQNKKFLKRLKHLFEVDSIELVITRLINPFRKSSFFEYTEIRKREVRENGNKKKDRRA